MKVFKKFIAVILCIATLVGGLTVMCSAKEEYDSTWTKLRVEGDEEITFYVPHKRISGGFSLGHDTYMVQTNGQRIEDCFDIPPDKEEDWGYLYYVAREEYIGQCVYLEKDDCYYAQYKIYDTDVKTISKKYGALQGIMVAVILVPLFNVVNAIEFNMNPEYFLIAHDTWENLK